MEKLGSRSVDHRCFCVIAVDRAYVWIGGRTRVYIICALIYSTAEAVIVTHVSRIVKTQLMRGNSLVIGVLEK